MQLCRHHAPLAAAVPHHPRISTVFADGARACGLKSYGGSTTLTSSDFKMVDKHGEHGAHGEIQYGMCLMVSFIGWKMWAMNFRFIRLARRGSIAVSGFSCSKTCQLIHKFRYGRIPFCHPLAHRGAAACGV